MDLTDHYQATESLFRLPAERAGRDLTLKELMDIRFHGVRVSAQRHLVETLTGSLSAEERGKADRFRQIADRERFVLGRAFVRALCARHLQITAAAVTFEETSTGRPHLPGGGFDFNVSHSGDCILIAWIATGQVGADVEWMRERATDTLAGMARISFSAEEREAFSAAPTQDKAAIFYRIWVRKEAIIKAEGVGLGGPLQKFSVVCLESGRTVWAEHVSLPQSDRIWALIDLVAPADYAAALAVPLGAKVHEGVNVLLA